MYLPELFLVAAVLRLETRLEGFATMGLLKWCVRLRAAEVVSDEIFCRDMVTVIAFFS